MANFEIPSNPEYTEQIKKFETKDPAHADLFNTVIGTLLNNDAFLKLAIDAAYCQGTGYTDQQIANLINGAPETLNTLGEIAEAMKNNSDVVEALNTAIGTKASQAEVDGHIGNDIIHIKASERQSWNDKQTKTGDVQDNIVTFESGDAIEPTSWANVALVTTKEKVSSLMRKFSLTVKNMRYLFKLIGNNQLSVGDGTITGAINALNTGLAKAGTVVGGTVVTTNVPSGVETTVATITLSPGSWIIIANIWCPDTLTVNLTIRNVMGVMGALMQPQVSGIVTPTTHTEYEIVCSQWEEHNITISPPYVLAIRIA